MLFSPETTKQTSFGTTGAHELYVSPLRHSESSLITPISMSFAVYDADNSCSVTASQQPGATERYFPSLDKVAPIEPCLSASLSPQSKTQTYDESVF